MPMQNFVFLFYVFASYVPDVAASRVRALKSSRTEGGDSSDSGLAASCIYECGAREVSVVWVSVKKSDGSVHSMSSAFTIGSGARIKYRPNDGECLSRCQVVDVNSKEPCGNLYKNSRKVSKNSDYKLCCVPRSCKYNPTQKLYEPHMEGDGWFQGLRPYRPLEDIKGTVVAARTCLCCKKERAEMLWDNRVKRHCKQAYNVSSAGNAVRGLVRLVTIKTSDVIHRARCRHYCSKYPDYPYAMRSKERRSIVSHAVTATGASKVSGASKKGSTESDEEED